MSDIIRPTPEEAERVTGEHAAIPEHMNYLCLEGYHDWCPGNRIDISDQAATIVLCTCPCHQDN